jgi:transposase-like protein
MELNGRWCQQAECRDYGKVDAGNIRVYCHSERRLYGRTCQHTFSADQGTVFETVRSERSAVLEVLALLGERNSLRAIERLTHHPHKASLHWLDLAGQHVAAVSAHLIRDLQLTQAQIDELWTFVKKSRNIWNRTTRLTWATCGSGAPWRCRVACGW